MTEASFPLRKTGRRFPGSRAVVALILREMSTTYGRSPGGYFWAIAEPVAAIGILSIAFSMFVRNPPLGQSFVLFYATGFLSLSAYQSISNNISASIRFSRALLAYPSVTYIDAIVARLILALFTQAMIFILVLSTTLAFIHGQTNIDFLVILRAWGMLVSLAVAVGLMNCYLMSTFPLWQTLWTVINRPMFLLSGVLFVVDNLPEDVRNIALMLPLTHFISMMRRGFYDFYDARYVSELYVYGISLVLGALGLLLLHRHHREILSER